MKKTILITLLLTVGYWLLAPNLVNAFEIPLTITSPEKTVSGENIANYIVRFYWFAVGAAGILAVGVIVFGAIYYMVSAQNPDKQRDAKSYITSALWGVALLLGSYLVLTTINPQITTLKSPSGGLGECLGLQGEKPGVNCVPKPPLPPCTGAEGETPGENCKPFGCGQNVNDPACRKEIATACINVWRECELVYPEKPGFQTTFIENVKAPFFNCTDKDSCEEEIKIQFVEIDADNDNPVTLVAYPFYKLFDSKLAPGKKVVQVRCAAIYAKDKEGGPFRPKNVTLLGKFWDLLAKGGRSIAPGETPETDLTTTLLGCQPESYYKRNNWLPQ